MDYDVVFQKIESLTRCLARIESKLPFSIEELCRNYDLQDVIVLNIERAIQISVDIATIILIGQGRKAPRTMAGAFEELAEAGIIGADLAKSMQKSVGFRNLAVHEYEKLSMEVVHAVCHGRLDDFKKFMGAVATLR